MPGRIDKSVLGSSCLGGRSMSVEEISVESPVCEAFATTSSNSSSRSEHF